MSSGKLKTLAVMRMGHAYADAAAFRNTMKRDNEVFLQLVGKLGLKA